MARLPRRARHAAFTQLNSAEDLLTPHAATRGGFVAFALEKNRRATPFIAQARALKAAVSQASSPAELLTLSEIQTALQTAAGLSDKSLKHLQEEDKQDAVRGLIANFLEPAGADWIEELIYRFLLTRGDTVSGEMKNVVGALGQRRLCRALIAALTLNRISYHWRHSQLKIWSVGTSENADIEIYLNGLSWQTNQGERTLLFNINPPLVGKNVDLCLLGCAGHDFTSQSALKTALRNPSHYVAFGELKAGIDPAGADEHWKTARTALVRIREAYAHRTPVPAAFFIGAAVVRNMADEIWNMLEDGTLDNAANLTDDDQLAAICQWLIHL